MTPLLVFILLASLATALWGVFGEMPSRTQKDRKRIINTAIVVLAIAIVNLFINGK